MKDVSLKTIVQEDNKTINIPQLYISGMDFLRYDIIEILNRQMSRDYKIEFGYEFVKYIKDFIKNFYKAYISDDKLKYFDKIDDDILEINIMIDMIEILKRNDPYNWVGFTEGHIINIRKNWGKLISQYDKYKSWYLKHNKITVN